MKNPDVTCDAIAMKVRYHDAGLHLAMAPAGPLSRAMHVALEDLRVEACACRSMQGVADNLSALFAYEFQLRGNNVLATDTATSLANAVVLNVRARLVGKPLPGSADRFVSRWQDEITRLAGNDIDSLCAVTDDQAAYARRSLRLIENLELADEPDQGPQLKPAEVAADNEAGEAVPDQGGESRQGDDTGSESLDTGAPQ